MWDPSLAPAPSSVGPNSRYAYLTGRLRSRQITMEEATELFGLMQGMLQRSETGRLALLSASRSRSPPVTPPLTAPAAPRTPVAVGPTDDMMLFGLLAMGAGSGLVAALAKRIQAGPPSTESPAGSTPDPRTG